MRIIYCRKQAQAALEYVNFNNPHLEVPFSLEEVCKNVKLAFLNQIPKTFCGLVYTYDLMDIGGTDVYCSIGVDPILLLDKDKALYEIVITDEELLVTNEKLISDIVEGLSSVLATEDVTDMVDIEIPDLDIKKLH